MYWRPNNMLLLKISLFLLNFFMFICGVCVLSYATIILVRSNSEYEQIWRLIPSSLPMPLSFYIILAAITISIALIIISICGTIAAKSFSNCIIAIYIFGLVVLIMNESIGIILSVIAPENLLKDSEIEIMVDLWQRNYGVPGREPYTTSIDYIQTKFGCCGVERGDEYVTSWWTIRQLSVPGLRVPLSCCIQQEPTTSSQDPQPVNITACQNQQFQIYSISRHIQGCHTQLKQWIKHQLQLITSIASITLFYHILLLLLTIISFIKLHGSHTS